MTARTLWKQTEVDYVTLAAAMLDDMKAQSRVYHTRDDAILQRHLAWALSTVERRANINLHAATYRSAGAVATACYGHCWCPMAGTFGYRLPFNNVRALRLFDAEDVDITGAWAIVQERFGSNAEAYAVNPNGASAAGGAVIELDVGVDDVAALDPAVVQAVQRIAASAYEHREAISPLTDGGFDAELMQIWRPTV
jgi:uncharacterized phiE125 gp8 family phage protein